MDSSTSCDRVIALIDMDCFYAQVEQQERPESKGKPLAAVAATRFKMVLSANYEARARGVKAGMRVDEAVAKCPDLIVACAPLQREKTDLTKYRNASSRVFSILLDFGAMENIVVEIASIDEAFLDLTASVRDFLNSRKLDDNAIVAIEDLPTSHVVTIGEEEPESLCEWLRRINSERKLCDLKLAVGAMLVERVRNRILAESGYHCSAGIGENKMLAKLVCKMHKPKRQTIVPRDTVEHLFRSTPVSDVRNLGGKLGASVIEKFGIETMAQLASISLEALKEAYKSKTAMWLYQLSRGIDTEEVVTRQLSKSIGCSKNFPGMLSLKTWTEINHWIKSLSEELEERLRRDQTANHRTARNLCISLRLANASSSVTRHCPLSSYDSACIVRAATRIVSEYSEGGRDVETWKIPITNLALSAGRFEDCIDVPDSAITDYFKPAVEARRPQETPVLDKDKEDPKPTEPAADDSSDDDEISVIPKPQLITIEDDEELERPRSPEVDMLVMDADTNSSEAIIRLSSDSSDSNSIDDQNQPSTSKAAMEPTDFKKMDPGKSPAKDGQRRDSDILAVSRDGGMKRRRLAEETAAAFLANKHSQIEAAKKGSFFLKRLQDIRRQEQEASKEKAEEAKAQEAKEAEKRRQLHERVAATVLVPAKKPASTSASTTESKFVDVKPWLPAERTALDDETWNDLPPEIQWELKQHFRRHSGGDQDDVKVVSVMPSKRKEKSSKVQGAKSKKAPGNGMRAISDYFQRP